MYLIDRERITHAYIPQPTALQMQELFQTRKYDLSSLFKDGNPAHWRATLVVPAHAPIAGGFGGYGQTEISGYITPSWLGGTGAGRPHALAPLRIGGGGGGDVAPGEGGEVVGGGAPGMVRC